MNANGDRSDDATGQAAARAREAVLAEHDDVLAATLSRADAAAARLQDPLTDGGTLATALEREFVDAGLLSRYVDVLETAVSATDCSLDATPVAAPPYVTVTSRGPVLRATTDAGRLVAVVAAFAVERAPVRYRRSARTPAEALSVTVRS